MINNNSGDFNQLDYNQLIFRQIDRIQIIAQTNFGTKEEKIFAFSWSIQLFRSLITDKLKDDIFSEEELQNKDRRIKILQKDKHHYDFKEDFQNLMELFQTCMNLFGRRGLLYKNVVRGIQRRE